MNNKIKKIKKYLNSGFSLMETLIWVGIVIIFSSLSGFVMFKQYERTKGTAAIQEVRTYATALLEFTNYEGRLPTEEEGLMILVEKDYIVPNNKSKSVVDPWGNEYIYTLFNDGKDFTIKSLGSDKQEGGEGTAKDIIFSSTNTGNESGNSTGLDYGDDYNLEK